MIFYVTHRKHAYTQAVVLLYHRPDLQQWLRLVAYEDAALLRGVARGVVIWTDMDRLTSGEISHAAALSEDLSGRTGLVQLNHPAKSLQRFDLLQALYADGINCFRVFRPDAIDENVTYPVFIRDEAGALYEEPPLLHNRAGLDAALESLSERLVRPMVVEMVGTPWPDGYFRKFAAFRVGDTIYAQHCAMSTSWFVKNMPEKLLTEHVDQILAYVRANPDADALMPIFDRAGVRYGRIDYSWHEGRLLVFEINTNPTVLSDPPTRYATYDAKPYADRHVDALLALPQAKASDTFPAIDAAHRAALSRLRRRYEFKRLKIVARAIFAR